ncbi:hypothetical protein IFM89_014930 [Coptis chinensis]|uniref:Amidase domain-containing protein n=1 Tax=Coptis chinensis TaxID=261450 RepID=A0A835H585_9MAGN|nr:hypothetical protein IFM89_014930 [Coptis chinensis]
MASSSSSSSSTAVANIFVLLGLGIAGIFLMTRNKLKKVIKEDYGAFVQRIQILPPPPPAPPKAPHPLTALTFAVSDVFDIDGYVTGFGSPDWARAHEAASRTSPVVAAVVEGGATCTGKTIVDELACSINGVNKYYGTPTNPAAPAHIPGGSSCGSAVAVAAKLVDFSIGIDTTGGVRVPAAFCGILGFRTSHGALSNTGIIPVSPSLDAVGWFANDPNILRRVGHALLQLPYVVPRAPRNIIIADDCFRLLKIPDSRVTPVVTKSVEKVFGKQVLNRVNLDSYLDSKVPSLNQFQNGNRNGKLKGSAIRSLANVMLFLQRNEFKSVHGEWIQSAKPDLYPDISTQLRDAVESADDKVHKCQSIRNETRSALNSLLKDDGVLVIPTVPGPPPKLGAKEILSEDYQSRSNSLLGIASMSGCCQVSVPLGYHESCPVSVSFVAKHGSDRFLLDVVQTMYASLQEQTDIASKSSLSRNTVRQEESAEIAKEKGNNAFKEKKWQKAIGFYTEAIKLNGNNATYYSNRAAAYLELGSFLQAESDCSTAINLDKKSIKAYLRRGTAREMLGYYKEATEDFKHALVLEPTNKRAALSADRLKKLFQ